MTPWLVSLVSLIWLVSFADLGARPVTGLRRVIVDEVALDDLGGMRDGHRGERRSEPRGHERLLVGLAVPHLGHDPAGRGRAARMADDAGRPVPRPVAINAELGVDGPVLILADTLEHQHDSV